MVDLVKFSLGLYPLSSYWHHLPVDPYCRTGQGTESWWENMAQSLSTRHKLLIKLCLKIEFVFKIEHYKVLDFLVC